MTRNSPIVYTILDLAGIEGIEWPQRGLDATGSHHRIAGPQRSGPQHEPPVDVQHLPRNADARRRHEEHQRDAQFSDLIRKVDSSPDLRRA